ncbi:MAG: RNB domain-containing ribonuclease, partial [Acidobacteriaceae bacterium]
AGKPEERILSYLMLRSLRQARYSERNEGHFALAAACYTHFTSPIRRYPDLIVHRITKALLDAGVDGHGVLAIAEPHGSAPNGTRSTLQRREKDREQRAAPWEPIPESELAAIGQESSESERRAADAERELVDWKKIKFMRDRVGEDFSGMILNATKYGLFVELGDLFVEGLVPIQNLGALDGDRYTYGENTRQIIGDRWGRKFSVGDQVRVVLDRVDAVEKRLQFSILEDTGPLATRKGGSGPAKSKQARREEKRAKAARKETAVQATKSAKRGKYRAPKANQLRKKKRR